MIDWTYIPSDSCTGGVAPELAYSALGRACVWRSVGGFLGLDRRASSRGVALSSPGPRGGSAGFSTLIRHTTLSVPTQPPRSYRQMPGLRLFKNGTYSRDEQFCNGSPGLAQNVPRVRQVRSLGMAELLKSHQPLHLWRVPLTRTLV